MEDGRIKKIKETNLLFEKLKQGPLDTDRPKLRYNDACARRSLVAFGERWGRVKLVSSKNKGALKIKRCVYVTHWRAQCEE